MIEGTGFNALNPLNVEFTSSTHSAVVLRRSDTKILTRVPRDATTGPVSVNGVAGPAFTVKAFGSPVIFHVRPSTVPAGGHVFLVGHHLGGTVELVDNNSNSTQVTNLRGGGRAMAFQVPPGLAAGTYAVRVTNGVGSTDPCSPSITVVAAGTPTITSVTPSSGPPGTRITFSGHDLGPIGPHRTSWSNGSVTRDVAAWSNGYDTAHSHVPLGLAAGTYTITYYTPSGVSPTTTFAVTAPTLATPVILHLRPDTGLPGRPFEIVGQHFMQQGGGRPTVGFGALTAPVFGFFIRNGNQVLISGPPRGAAPGPHGVTVTNAGGTSNSVVFTLQ